MVATSGTASDSKVKQAPKHRMWARAVVLGYRRAQRNIYPNFSLLEIEGVRDIKDTEYYIGKRVAYVTKSRKAGVLTAKYNWGTIVRHHGGAGVVRAKFNRNLPPKSFGRIVRVYMFPSYI